MPTDAASPKSGPLREVAIKGGGMCFENSPVHLSKGIIPCNNPTKIIFP